MPSSEPPHVAVRELFAGVVQVHPRCGRPMGEHGEWVAPESPCEFPRVGPIEFAVRPAEASVRVCGLPDPAHLSPELEAILGDLARRVREEYGIGVEVTADDDLDEVRAALETIRRRLDL